ncbi:acyltransferase [Phytoactinopolyspora halotolerans]|uniref:Acyltransferase n=1 Tax=Phytoactinopolyspora halotolerans TaxID=1981512 RepID=A0A6L9SGC2_9ACTN|nr:acyltransferase [Phytoactinopolyspora halotolerans]
MVFGHWMAIVVWTGDELDADSALEYLTWGHPLTWILQVMPLFFLVGGYANAASIDSHHRRGGDTFGWLLNRGARLLRPTTVFLVALAAAGATARLLGADASTVALGVWGASIPLWFLVAYISLVFLAPLAHAAHARYGMAFPVVAGVLVLLVDTVRIHGDAPIAGNANYLLVWLIFHQLGVAWHEGGISATVRAGVPLCGAGLVTLVALTTVGPYPVSMVSVPGAELQNATPPTFALLVLGLTQCAAAMALSGPVNRALRGARAWTGVVAVNTVVLTLFLWHMAAAVLVSAVLVGTGIMPQPDVDSAAWLLLRLPWLAACAVVLAGLVALFARIELRTAGLPRIHTVDDAALTGRLVLRRGAWRVMVIAAIVSAVGGLLIVAAAGSDYVSATGVPPAALGCYLVGVSLLRFARARHSRADAEPRQG